MYLLVSMVRAVPKRIGERGVRFFTRTIGCILSCTMIDKTRVTLLHRIKDPDNIRAWEEFDAIYRPMLERFAMGRGLDHAAAEDVVQQCMTAIQRVIGAFNSA